MIDPKIKSQLAKENAQLSHKAQREKWPDISKEMQRRSNMKVHKGKKLSTPPVAKESSLL